MHPAGRANGQLVSAVKSEDLIEIYRRSNRPEDFEQIVRRFAALVLCECRRVTGNIYDAEDASQLVFLALAMEIKSGTNIQSLGAWLKRVSRRQALKIVRSRTRRKRREDAVRREEMHLVDTDSPLDQAVIAGIVRDAIDQLPDRYRMAVVLHYFGGMSLELIAVELKISKQAVGTRLHRGRKMLAERLNRQGVKLDNGTLAVALSVLVPAAVVSAVVKSASSVSVPHAVATMPMAMTQMLRAMAVHTVHRPLRLAAVAAALAVGGSGLAMVVDSNLASLRQIAPSDAIRWIERKLQNAMPNFSPAPIGPISDMRNLKPHDPQAWLPNIEPLSDANLNPNYQLMESRNAPAGSNGPLRYANVQPTAPAQFAVPRSAGLAAPILSAASIPSTNSKNSVNELAQPLAFSTAHSNTPARDWTAPEPMTIATRTSEVTTVQSDSDEHCATSDDAAKTNATTDVTVANGTTTSIGAGGAIEADDVRIGIGPGAVSTMLNTGGQINANRMSVGLAGTGVYRQRGAAQLNAGQILIGVQPQSNGEVFVDSGTIEVTSPAGIQVGVMGSGKLWLGSADEPGTIHAAAGIEAPVVVRGSSIARGEIRGWGTLGTGGALINNGQIIADGSGQNRVLDVTNFATVTNTLDNPLTGTNGWYATNGGSLVLPPITVSSGTHAYTWGESATDPSIDLVNSVRFTVHNQPAPTTVSISLDSVTIAGAPAVTLPKGLSVVSLYHLATPAFGALNTNQLHFVVRYDQAAANDFIYGEASLNLYAYESLGWISATSVYVDPSTRQIAGDFSGGVEYLAVGMPFTDSIGSTNLVLLPVHGTVSSFASPVVPEPSGLILLATGAVLFRRRRRQ